MAEFKRSDASALIDHLFGDAADGRVELAWTNPKTGNLQHAEQFDTGNLEALIDRAEQLNATEGVNVHVGAALRAPGSAPFGRAKDADFHAATAAWADIDDGDAVRLLKDRWQPAPPTLVVITGKTPHLRAQLWWRLSEPCQDADRLRSIVSAIAETLHGDPAVVNPSRLMALPGSTKWPMKPGRVVETVEIVPSDSRPDGYTIEQLEAAYLGSKKKAKPKNFAVGGSSNTIDPEALLASIGPGNVHGPLLRVVGHCVGCGYDDWAIQQLVGPYLDKGNEARTAADVQQMIDGARKKLGIQPRKSPVSKDRQEAGSTLELPRIEPHAEPVDGVELLDAMVAVIRRYMVIDRSAAEAVALWCIYAHTAEAFYYQPRLLITSPQKRCGKSTLRCLIQRMVPSPLPVENITTAALFRAIDAFAPTILLDEADRFLKQNSELIGIVNAGHTRDGTVLRTVGDSHEVKAFRASCPTVISGIGRIPDTIEDRSITIRLERRKADEPITRLRMDRTPDLDLLARKAARWAEDHIVQLGSDDPDMPAGLNDRAADNWRPG